MRFDSTDKGRQVVVILAEAFASMTPQRKAPEYYASGIQREAYLKVYAALNGNLAELARKGVARGRYSRENLLAWLENCVHQEEKPTTQAGPTLRDLGYA